MEYDYLVEGIAKVLHRQSLERIVMDRRRRVSSSSSCVKTLPKVKMLISQFKILKLNDKLERIVQTGKKKLVLDHLIVQKMDDDEDSPGENMESILTYGAQALFDSEQAAKEIVCKLLYPALF